jgi:RND family efflux transporter MFP subunit
MKRVRNGALAITPITGVVVKKHIELYQELNTGSPTFQVADLTRMKIIVGVPEADIVGIRDFGKADVRFAALPNRVFEGVPMNFARARSDSTLTYTLEIIVDNSEGLLLSGTTAQVRLVLRTFTDVVVIPVRALFNRSEGAFAMIVENGVARERRLTLGKGDAAEVIVEGGLNPGAQIVVEGINRIADGSLVEIVR